MKFIIATILYALLAFAACLFFPWWSIAITSFVVALLVHQKALVAYAAAFLGVSLLWAAQAYWVDLQNDHVLSQRVATLLPLGGSTAYLIQATGLVGGLVSAFAAMAGSYLRPVRRKVKPIIPKEEPAFVA